MGRIELLTAAALATSLAFDAIADEPHDVAAEAAEEKSLTIGDPAPQLDIAHWIKGELIEAFEEGQIYVIEFWATWCGPCLTSMPHISELQDKYRDYDVTIVGISDEPLSRVVEFLVRTREEDQLWYHTITYTLATDPRRIAHQDYMQAAGQRGIPTAFIVGRTGKVEWIGHPMRMDDPLEKLVRNKWDREEFREGFVRQQKHGREIQRLNTEFRTARSGENWPVALRAINSLIELDNSPFYKIEKFLLLARDMNVPGQAYRFANEAAEENWDKHGLLNHLAWVIVDESGIRSRDLDFAYRIARHANELTEFENGAYLDTLARVYYEKGELDKALEWQRKAVKHAEGTRLHDSLKDTLKKYDAAATERGND